MIIIHTDGGARGNPGPAAIGVVIEQQLEKRTIGKYLGSTTNNVAEYTAILEALTSLIKEKGEREEIEFFLDSQLVQRQLSGIYQIKEPTLQTLARTIKSLEKEWGSKISYTHVPREKNKEADKIVNEVLDATTR